MFKDKLPSLHGRISINRLGETNPVFRSNTVLYNGADLVGRLIVGQAVAPNYMYIEFSNSGPVETPVFTKADGLAYYQQLGRGQDILRVPLIASNVRSSGDNYLTNLATFYSVSQGTVGVVHTGPTEPFTVDSIVYGAALVYAPDVNDMTKDIVFARGYPDNPLTKGTGQITVTWDMEVSFA